MKKIVSALVGVAALAMSPMAANAATISFGSSGSTVSPGTDIGINVDNIEVGDVATNASTQGSFNLGAGVEALAGEISLDRANGTAPGIQNLVLMLYSDMARTNLIGSVAVTDAAGVSLAGSGNQVSFLIAGLAGVSSIFFGFTGTSFAAGGGVLDLADINIRLSAVPVPGALPLLLSGLAGLGFASRRRKTA